MTESNVTTIALILLFVYIFVYIIKYYLEYVVWYFIIMISLALFAMIPMLLIEIYRISTKPKKHPTPLQPFIFK
jgi:hypothetical protein